MQPNGIFLHSESAGIKIAFLGWDEATPQRIRPVTYAPISFLPAQDERLAARIMNC